MKCLSCKEHGKGWQYKICPICTSKGFTKDSIEKTHESAVFIGTRFGVNVEAGRFVNKLKKEKNVSHVNMEFSSVPMGYQIEVKWIQYEPKPGEVNGDKKPNKSK